jgi:hypothetical protein
MSAEAPRDKSVFLALLAAMVALLTIYFQNSSAERQVHQRAQSDLVVEAIKTGDPKLAAKNLRFLLDLGLLDDPDGKLKAALSNPETAPYLPVPRTGYGQGGYGEGGYGGKGDHSPDRPPK